MFRPSSPQSDGTIADVSYIIEIERVSSSLVQLLQAIQKHVKTSYGIFQRHHIVNRIAFQEESDKDLFRPADRKYMQTSLDIPEYTSNILPEHDYKEPGGICSFSYKTAPADCSASETGGAKAYRRSSISLSTKRDELKKGRDRQCEDTYDKIQERDFRRSADFTGQHVHTGANDRSKKQTKYSISIEFEDIIKRLRINQDYVQQLEGKMRKRDRLIKKLALRLERLELLSIGKPTNMRGTEFIQKETSLKEQHSDLNLHGLRSDTLKTPLQTFNGGAATVDLSITSSDASISSNFGRDSDTIECTSSSCGRDSDNIDCTPSSYRRDSDNIDCNV